MRAEAKVHCGGESRGWRVQQQVQSKKQGHPESWKTARTLLTEGGVGRCKVTIAGV